MNYLPETRSFQIETKVNKLAYRKTKEYRCRFCNETGSYSDPLLIPCQCIGEFLYSHNSCIKVRLIRIGLQKKKKTIAKSVNKNTTNCFSKNIQSKKDKKLLSKIVKAKMRYFWFFLYYLWLF